MFGFRLLLGLGLVFGFRLLLGLGLAFGFHLLLGLGLAFGFHLVLGLARAWFHRLRFGIGFRRILRVHPWFFAGWGICGRRLIVAARLGSGFKGLVIQLGGGAALGRGVRRGWLLRDFGGDGRARDLDADRLIRGWLISFAGLAGVKIGVGRGVVLAALFAEVPDFPPVPGPFLTLVFVHRFQLHGPISTGHQTRQRSDESGIHPAIFAGAGIELLECGQRMRRTLILVIAVVAEVLLVAAFPAVVFTVAPAIVGVNRIIAVATGVIVIRGVIAGLAVLGIIVVTEVVMTLTRTEKEVLYQRGEADHRARTVIIIRPGIIIPGETDRRENHAATVDGVVVVSINANVASRGLDVIRRDPHPVGPGDIPVSRTPEVTGLPPNP